MNTEPFVYHEDSPELLYIDSWMMQLPWVMAGFTTRQGGRSQAPYASLNVGMHVGDNVEHVVHNRKQVAAKLDHDFSSWTCANQIHSTNIMQVSQQERGYGRDSLDTCIQDTDGLFTAETDVLLTTFYADCVPLLFVDPINRVVGLAHAGWKGTVGQIGVKMLELWEREYNSRREDILVAIGPAIGGCCYEVDEHVMKHIRPYEKLLSPQAFRQTSKEKYLLDLKQVNLDLLLQAGISPTRIEISSWCTSCDQHLFFSHRKEQGTTGRMAAFIAIKNGTASTKEETTAWQAS